MYRRTLGFDLRLRPTDKAPPDWSPDRRQRFLLRPEVEWPLSIDKNVWDCLFWYRFGPPYETRWLVRAAKPESFPHTIFHLWQDFIAMVENGGTELLRIGLPVRVDLLMLTPWQEVERWHFLVDFAEPIFGAPEDWQSLGYDVCDESFCSGLTNCGYEEERAEWRARWAPKLNEHGLFHRVGDAFKFCSATDGRVSEHAPFYVLELLRLLHWPSAAVA